MTAVPIDDAGDRPLRLYDTRTRSVRDFEPLEPGRVGLYVCGPTVQAAPHVGHLVPAVAFDILQRWLQARGNAVTFVRNVTDVDDKIIDGAAAEGVSWAALAERSHRAFVAAYDALGVLPPTVEPRATGHVPEMIALIWQLVESGHAYASGGDVYLSVRTVPGYGELSGQNPDALRTGLTEAVGDKRDPLDFTLWKAAKPGEPAWDTPWGAGRPGWHLECSAMAVKHLGVQFDLHGGGRDLVFPHHENELAQSTAAGHPFARYWLHNGLLTLPGGEKMSKSLGNSLLVADLLQRTRPQVLRYALGASHYRSTLTWSDRLLDEAAAAYDRFETFARNAVDLLGGVGAAEAAGLDAPVEEAAWARFSAAMDDDLAVPQALAVVHGVVRAANSALQRRDRPAVASALAVVRRMLAVLGLDPVSQWPAGAGSDRLTGVVDALVAVALDARAQARERRDYAAADAIRDRLAAAGLVVEDTADGVRWRLESR